MKSTKLPKIISTKPYATYLLPLCEKYDGNTIVLICNRLFELITNFPVENEEKVFEKFVEILSYNEAYTYKKLLNYIDKLIENETDKIEYYEKLTNSSTISLNSILNLILMYNKAITKLHSLNKAEIELRNKYRTNPIEEAHNWYPKYLSFTCLQVNKEIAKITEMQNIVFPAAVEKMKRFDGEIMFKGKKYIAETPKNVTELILEGYIMHNCLVMRGPDVAKENMRMMFIKTEDRKSYIDVILDTDYNIIWAIKDMHANVQGDDKELVAKWHNMVLETVKETTV